MEKGTLSNSQIGRLESLITANKYNTENAKNIVVRYFEHTIKKEKKQTVNIRGCGCSFVVFFDWLAFGTGPGAAS